MPAVALALFYGGRVAALVKVGCMAGNAALECGHDFSSPAWHAGSAVHGGPSVLCTIHVSVLDPLGVETNMAVETLVSGEFTQHAARPVFTWNVSEVAQNVAMFRAVISGRGWCRAGAGGGGLFVR